MDGFLNLLKPPGMSSSDAVTFVRRRLGAAEKVGHAGTLDEEAAGVLPIMIGRATRLFDHLVDKRKEYVAQWMPGVSTDTQDALGTVVARSAVVPDRCAQDDVLSRFIGDIRQTPPMYSALKVGGRAAYDLARRGEAVELAERDARVYELEWLGDASDGGRMLRVVCGRGVYIRTLCEDIGKALGCEAHMAFLLRTMCGAFTIGRSVTIEECANALADTGAGTFAAMLEPLDVPLTHLPRYDIDPVWRERARCGNPVPYGMLTPDMRPGGSGSSVRLYLDDRLVGIGLANSNSVAFKPMLI